MSGRLFLAATALLCCVPGGASGDQTVKIQTFVGETVILPCQIQLSADKEVLLVEWSKDGLERSKDGLERSKDGLERSKDGLERSKDGLERSKDGLERSKDGLERSKDGLERSKPTNITFLYRQGCELFEEKHPHYRYRTSLFLEELKNGNLSLRLSDVRLSDAGKYKCKSILKEHRSAGTIELRVGAVSEPRLSVVAGAAVTVLCAASCWFPPPKVSILDARGNEIVAKEPQIDGDSTSGCFSVSSRATVTTGNNVSCRVHQSAINQTRVTEIYIPDECMSSCSPVLVIAVVLSIIGTIVVIAMIESPLVYWKCRNSEGERKLLSAKSSQQNSTSNIAEGQNLISQVDPVQTATAEHQREVVELKSNLRDKDETIRRLTEELNDLTSKQSPVECYLGHPTIHRNPSTASRGVSKPTDHPQEQLPQHINPKPAADSNHPKSVKLSQNKDAKPSVSRQIPEPGLQIPGSSHNIHVSPADHPEGKHGGRLRSVSDSLPRSNTAKPQRRATISPRNRFSVLANLPNDGSEPLLE